MKITEQYTRHTSIGTEFERLVTGWNLVLDETDGITDPKMFERFKTINIEQHNYKDGDFFTHFRGYRTNCFNDETNDKQKLLIIDKVNNFLDNTPELVASFVKLKKLSPTPL